MTSKLFLLAAACWAAIWASKNHQIAALGLTDAHLPTWAVPAAALLSAAWVLSALMSPSRR